MGTVEDWYLINTIPFGHPIHVHLINFQVVREYDLLLIGDGSFSSCSIYELDFLLDALAITPTNANTQAHKSKSFNNQNDRSSGVNYSYVCKNKYPIGQLKQVRNALSIIYQENQITSDRKSGLDLFTIATNQDK